MSVNEVVDKDTSIPVNYTPTFTNTHFVSPTRDTKPTNSIDTTPNTRYIDQSAS